MPIDYDPSSEALLHPGLRPTLFEASKVVGTVPLAAEAARLAYVDIANDEGMTKLTAALATQGFTGVTPFTSAETDSQAFGAFRVADRTTLLAFRGTEPDKPEDLLIDATFFFEPWQHGRVHRGFARATLSLQPQINDYLRARQATSGTLILCGHSLGAALATLFASLLPDVTLVTIGSPRVGDQVFVDSLSAVKTTRIVDCCDAVTKLPPFPGWRHVGETHFITHEGELVVDPAPEFISDDERAGRASYLAHYALHRGNVHVREFADHAPINYLRAFF
ncbi:Lipase (class 3) [Caballeronia hypogeia]|uniref:Lipase (Class 3) n=1 Tax=Caballeronia hypogeia TaxID=1777140 RepID=A0A157ZJJ4_9BURK|nr:lipase family protein [Caballeronia hypogeia]SAK45609.1 Lipase (class 3) [Caballeronia hypogeia]